MTDYPRSEAIFGEGTLPFKLLSEVESVPIEWLWYPYIPKSGLTMIVGEGGYGKSWMTCALAADLSSGRALPGAEALPPQRILMLSAEDGLGEVIRPKLEMMEADLSCIVALDQGFVLRPDMVNKICASIKAFDAAIVFLDPMVVYMGGDADMNKANEVREVFARLDRVAKETHCALVAVHHVRKMNAGTAQNKALGSVDFVNGVRSMMMVEVSKSGQYYMQHVKSNWARKGPALAYSMDNDRFEWQGEYMGGGLTEDDLSHTPRGMAKQFLIDVLKNGPVPSADFMKLCLGAGINERTLRRAKRGVARSFQMDRAWFWELERGVLEAYNEESHRNHPGNTVLAEEISAGKATGASAEQLLAQIGRGNGASAPKPVPVPADPPPASPVPADIADIAARYRARRAGQ